MSRRVTTGRLAKSLCGLDWDANNSTFKILFQEQLEVKDIRAKTHQQLKEAAIQMSRTNARAAEAARLEVKQKDDTFLEAARHVTLLTSIGRGPRTGLVNASSVKFG